MSDRTRKLVYAAALLSICIISQFMKNTSVFITGPIINACLIICVLATDLKYSIILSVITPITAAIITGSPVTKAVPLVIPFIMLGNLIIVLAVYFLRNIVKKPFGLPVSMIIGSIVKALVMWLTIALWIIPSMIPNAAPKLAEKIPVFQNTFSTVQLITALIGSALAFIIWIPVSKVIEEGKAEGK